MPINTSADADNALRTIGRINRDIKEEEILLNDALERMKKAIDEKLQPKLDMKRSLEAELEDWAKRFLPASKLRSLELTYGTLGYRDYPPEMAYVKGHNQESVAKLLLKKGYDQCVNVKYSVIKNAVKALELTEEKLRALGIRVRQKKNQFFYEVDEQKIAEEK